jgi:hypothetical protein
MSKFKLEFTLKQHTPIIHFQSDQAGATLRATELKPKFDRFLIEAFEKEGVDYSKFLIAGQDGALDYKVKIISRQGTKGLPNKSLYFANNPIKTDEDKMKTLINSNIKVEFFSYKTNIIEVIKECFDEFMFVTNFGTRQSKGFGSFLRSNITDDDIKRIIRKQNNKVFLLGTYQNNEYDKAFSSIDTFYKKIKMGINKPYYKSLIFRYMCSKYDIGWEKKFIKNNFPKVIHGTHSPIVCKKPDDREFKYIRAVLGLAEHNEFRPNGGKRQIKIKSLNGIDRFKSPITFKIFNGKIYILYNNSYKKILDKEFSFSLNRVSKTIKTPKEFNLYEFLKFVEKQEKLISEVN